jgi:two-component system nitrate/nitrite response regulator NarL
MPLRVNFAVKTRRIGTFWTSRNPERDLLVGFPLRLAQLPPRFLNPMGRPSRRRIRLLIADDERLFREGLALLLETEPRFHVVGHAADGIQAIDLCRRLTPDVLLLDLAMPRLGGMQALQTITADAPEVHTIVMTGSITRDSVVAVLHHGARGVVVKDVAPELLFKSIHAVMQGQYWIGHEVVSDLVAVLRRSNPAPPQPATRRYNLTSREMEIVERVVKGESNKEIANALGVTEDTVKHHLTSVFDKVGVSSRVELAVFALHNELI